MRNSRGIAIPALAAALAFSLAACSPITRDYGYAPSDADLEDVVIGVDTRDTLADVVGAPSAAGVMRDSAWYYVASRWEARGPLAPEEVEREVVAVSFDQTGVVTNIERFGLAEGQVIALNRRVTEDNIKGVSFLRQLLGNVGNLTAEQLLDQ